MLEKALRFIFEKADEKKDNVEIIENFGVTQLLNRNTGRIDTISRPKVETIRISTLTGIVDFLSNNIDTLDLTNFFILITSDQEVALLSRLTEGYLNRNLFLNSCNQMVRIPYENKYTYFEFASMLYEYFVHTPELKELIAKLNGIKAIKDTQFTNNGIEVTVQRKVGITLIGSEIFDPVVSLRPYRTFREVEQPESKFLIEITEHEDIPYFSIKPVDGGLWKNVAINNIKEWLETKLKEKTIDIGIIA